MVFRSSQLRDHLGLRRDFVLNTSEELELLKNYGDFRSRDEFILHDEMAVSLREQGMEDYG